MFRLMKVRPPNGWPSVIWELGIVTLGVLIALGFQELISSLNARQSAAEARQSIRAEIGENLGYLAKRIRTEQCISTRFREISSLLDRASTGASFEPPKWIGRPQVWGMTNYRLEAASNAGRLSLFPSGEQSQLTDIYSGLAAVTDAQAQEQMLWADLRSLEGQRRLSETTISSMRSDLARAKLADWRIRLAYSQALDVARDANIDIIPSRYPGSRSVCLSIRTPREIALARIGGEAGEP